MGDFVGTLRVGLMDGLLVGLFVLLVGEVDGDHDSSEVGFKLGECVTRDGA